MASRKPWQCAWVTAAMSVTPWARSRAANRVAVSWLRNRVCSVKSPDARHWATAASTCSAKVSCGAACDAGSAATTKTLDAS